MFRAPGLFAALALGVVIAGGAIWIRASLASAFAQGEAYGRALASVESRDELARQAASLEAIRRETDRDAAEIEGEKDALREKLNDVERRLASGGAAGGAFPCLDPGLVRALDAIGRAGPAARAP